MLILTVKASISRVMKFIITVAPLYVAYVVLGVALFSDHSDLVRTCACATVRT